MYISLTEWRDLTDGHLYSEGDVFPHDGRSIPPERINALVIGRNRAGFALIRAVGVPVEKEESQKENTPKRAAKSRKTATK